MVVSQDLEFLAYYPMMNKIKIEELNPDNFLSFGDVIDKDNCFRKLSINQGTTIRYHDVSRLKLTEQTGAPAISIFSGSPRNFPIEIKIMEKHPIASQTFLPIQNFDWLIVVSKEKNELPDIDTLRCFKVKGNIGITYNANVWHHPLLVNKKQDFWIVDRIKDKEISSINLKEYHFKEEEIKYLYS